MAGRCCAYACNMDAAEVLHFARKDAELTVRELAERAGVAASTVSRIERRQMDPTVGMLARLLAAAGQELELTTHRTYSGRLNALTDAWRVGPDGMDRPDWTRLRAFLDHLWLHPALVRGAIQAPPSGPVIFLADHPVTGGYPVVAVLHEEDVDRAAQLRPGQRLRLHRRPKDARRAQPG